MLLSAELSDRQTRACYVGVQYSSQNGPIPQMFPSSRCVPEMAADLNVMTEITAIQGGTVVEKCLCFFVASLAAVFVLSSLCSHLTRDSACVKSHVQSYEGQ